MTIRLFLGLSLLNALSLHGATASTTATPAGWHVKAAPMDASLRKLSDAALLDALLNEPGRPGTINPLELVFLPLESPEISRNGESLSRRSPVMAEIVRRGISMIPTLLLHLTDTRPTPVRLDPKQLHLNGTSGALTDTYDYRFHENGPQPSGVNTLNQRTAPKGQWPYTVKVGDMCYVALGQIVNRRLFVAGPDWGNGITVWSGIFTLSINSPVEAPALAAAARADWSGITADQLAQSLKNDALGLNNPKMKVVNDVVHSEISPLGGFKRLLFYFPAMGSEVAEALLSRPLKPWGASPATLDSALLMRDSETMQLLEALAKFRWDTLNGVMFALYTRAAEREETFISSHPPAQRLTIYGVDIPLACAKLLLHRNHDGEFRTFFAGSIERANRERAEILESLNGKGELVMMSIVSMVKAATTARSDFLAELDSSAR